MCQYYAIQKITDNTHLICDINLDSALVYENNNLKNIELDPNNLLKDKSQAAYSLLQFKNYKYLALKDGEIRSLEGKIIKVDKIPGERYVHLQNDKILAINPKLGARILFMEEDSLISTSVLFKNIFISSASQTENGVLVLGTFGNGICIIPNLAIKSLAFENPLRGITCDSYESFYVSSKNGEIIKSSNAFKQIIHTSKRTMDKIYYDITAQDKTPIPHLIFDPFCSDAGVLKDFHHDSLSNTSYVATSTGVFKYGNIKNHNKWELWKDNNIYKLILKPERFRTVCVAQNQSLYFGNATSLFRLHGEQLDTILSQGNHVACIDLEVDGDTIIAATEDHGLLFIYNNKIVSQINPLNNLNGSLKILKLKKVNDQLFFLTSRDLQKLNLKTKTITYFGPTYDYFSNSISDFDLNKSNVYVLSKNQVTIIPTESYQDKIKFDFMIDSIKVHGENVNSKTLTALKHDQNQLDIFYNCNSLLHQDQIKIKYKLIGLDNSWQTADNRFFKISYPSIPPGSYELQIIPTCRNVKLSPVILTIQINSPYYTKWWFYLLIIVFVAIVVSLFYFIRIKQLNKINEANVKKKIAEIELQNSQLAALRSQMNPHFIFNSLNSIQNLVLQQETDKSYDYLVLFSELIRNTLNYSGKDFIPIQEELNFLEVYLNLEKLRFEEELEYSIIYQGSKNIEIPSLLVQPFVENALLHGLLHKHGLKKLFIKFTFDKELICEITDNGIGRQESEKIKRRKGYKHESFGTKAINQRIHLFNKKMSLQTYYKFVDLEQGTKVIINIPFKELF